MRQTIGVRPSTDTRRFSQQVLLAFLRRIRMRYFGVLTSGTWLRIVETGKPMHGRSYRRDILSKTENECRADRHRVFTTYGLLLLLLL